LPPFLLSALNSGIGGGDTEVAKSIDNWIERVSECEYA
jgi:hypothetical protein